MSSSEHHSQNSSVVRFNGGKNFLHGFSFSTLVGKQFSPFKVQVARRSERERSETMFCYNRASQGADEAPLCHCVIWNVKTFVYVKIVRKTNFSNALLYEAICVSSFVASLSSFPPLDTYPYLIQSVLNAEQTAAK
jgi:hypothetical protein